MLRLNVFVVAVSCLLSSSAIAQQFYFQPWDNWSGSHESRVASCEDPQPTSWIGLDDFGFQEDGTLDALIWWGEVLDPAQVQQPHGYYIAIYADNECAPGDLLYCECVKPKVAFAVIDCHDGTVVRFKSGLAGGFQVVAGERYWLQISEDDERSANVGIEDFRWSGRQPVQNCFAMQMDAAGNVIQPLINPCPDQHYEVDLSFVLRAN